MVQFVLTVDYEIYGNGRGSLRQLVYEPAERLFSIFYKQNCRLVIFVEVAELEMIEAFKADPDIDLVKTQLRKAHEDGFEIGLHIHPQWYKGKFEEEQWQLDYSEYNLCSMNRSRISEIVCRSISYLRSLLGQADFVPLSFRAGNWLFQPTRTAAEILVKAGIKVDSSVFKGGLQRGYGLDYRPSLKNGNWWRFTDDVNVADPRGIILELPIYTRMVFPWKMLTWKRVKLQGKHLGNDRNRVSLMTRVMDYLRLWHPLKLDFCRMTFGQMKKMLDAIIRRDAYDPSVFWPVVAIGHTKDLKEFETLEFLLQYLERKGISVATFADIYPKCTC